MRILEQTPDRLVLELRPVALMILCAGLFLLFFVLGFGMRLFLPAIAGLMGMSEMPGLSAIPKTPGMNLLGYASVIPLLVAVFLIKTRRLTFDRPKGQITIASRGLLGHGEKTYPLADLQGAGGPVMVLALAYGDCATAEAAAAQAALLWPQSAGGTLTGEAAPSHVDAGEAGCAAVISVPAEGETKNKQL